MNLTVLVVTASQLAGNIEENAVKVIGRFNNEAEALKFVETNKPAIILLDYETEKENTGLLVSALLIESPESKVILLGEKLSDETILNCLIGGISGYLEWEDVAIFLHKAICSVAKGEAWFSRRLVGLLIERLRD